MMARVLLALAVLVPTSICSYVRREVDAPQPVTPSGDDAAVIADEPQLLANVGSSGAVTALANEAQAAESLRRYQLNYFEAEALLERLSKNDVYDSHGFQVEEVPIQKRLEEIKQEKKDQAAQLLQVEKTDTHEKTAFKNANTYDGRDAVVTGFWAKDRPNEERIDPDNMKIYTFNTYQKRFPFTHSWNVEVEWKKLPLAPKKVSKVARKEDSKRSESLSPVLLESGTMLVDGDMRELVWTRDSNGYYHMGTDIPSAEEMFSISHPREAKLRSEAEQRALQKKSRGIYPDHSSHLSNIKKKLKSSRRIDREDAKHRLEHMLMEMQNALKLQPSRTGKAFLSVRGAEGYLCSFNANIGKVNGLMVKHRIENATGIPWEAQKLRIKGKDFKDTDLLNIHVGAGRNAWIELLTQGWEITRRALLKRGKIQEPTAHAKQSQSTDILAEVGTEAKKQEATAKAASNKASESSPDSKAPAAALAAEDAVPQSVEDQMTFFEDDEDKAAKKIEYTAQEPQAEKEINLKEERTKLEEVENQIKAAIREQWAEEREQQQQAQKAMIPEQHAVVTRKVVYTKDADGKWHAEKAPLTDASTEKGLLQGEDALQQKLWDGLDEGIPVEDRIQEVSDAEAQGLLEAKSRYVPFAHKKPHVSKLEQALQDFRKAQKHALSEEMKWKLSQQKARDEERIKGANAVDSGKSSALKATSVGVKSNSLLQDPQFDEAVQMQEKGMQEALAKEQEWSVHEEAREAAVAEKHRAQSATAATEAQQKESSSASSVPVSHKPSHKRHHKKRQLHSESGEEVAQKPRLHSPMANTDTDFSAPTENPHVSEADVTEGVVAAPDTFLQLSSSSSAAGLTRSDPQELGDAALAEEKDQGTKVMYVLEKESKQAEELDRANEERVRKVKEWVAEANPKDDYNGKPDSYSLNEISKRRSERNKAYDGLQAVGSGFWADDRPDERRVDISDHKIYTWRQYRLKHPDEHSWNLEARWKKLPTEKRVKELGKDAFIQRFR